MPGHQNSKYHACSRCAHSGRGVCHAALQLVFGPAAGQKVPPHAGSFLGRAGERIFGLGRRGAQAEAGTFAADQLLRLRLAPQGYEAREGLASEPANELRGLTQLN